MPEETISQGEPIDLMTIDEILNHPHFHSLKILRGVHEAPAYLGGPSYYEITFESDNRLEDGWQTFYGAKITFKMYRFYKLKK